MARENPNIQKIALLMMFGLIFMILFYRMQAYLPFLFSPASRIALYSSLLFIIIRAPNVYRQLYWGILILFGFVAFVGLHTLYASGMRLAFHATGRFINVMLLAPFAALLFDKDRYIEKVFWLLWGVCVCALLSAFFQFWGGHLNYLVKDYVAIRGNLYRYMTIVGEPNVGGMSAVMVFVSSTMLARRRWFAVLLAGAAVVFVFFSVSKAAMLGMAVATVTSCIVLTREDRPEVILRAVLAIVVGLLLLQWLGANGYISVSVESILGGIRGEPSAIEDLHSRQGQLDAIHAIFNGSLMPPPFNYLLGASFANVGSAAQEIRGVNFGVVLPHNSYLELLLTGGAGMLIIVLLLMIRAYATIWRSRALPNSRIDRCTLICFVVLSCYMLVYPVIYEPVTGCLFWIIVGYGNRMSVLPVTAQTKKRQKFKFHS